ncbi:MAG: carboxynorspermidine decarboxylase [Alphaproteobacteria bacterium]|nr:carboxynorspermidine decarboxylase [Alphaproteobacteria bacterium]
MQHRISSKLNAIQTPAFVVDELRLGHNLKILADIKTRTGAKILFAIKGCPLMPIFQMIGDVLDGFTASGVYEARLAKDGYKKSETEIHTFCPAYSEQEIHELLSLQNNIHIYFNSLEQLNQFGPIIRKHKKSVKIGLRINPALSLAKFAKYDPCRAGSHFGVAVSELSKADWTLIDTLHVHALCENMAEESARLITQVGELLKGVLHHVKTVNFGGGHFITHVDYKLDVLVHALNEFKKAYPHITPVLEPGAAVVYDAGYLVASVLGLQNNEGTQNAVLDASANAHVPDVMKAGIRLSVLGETETSQGNSSTYTFVSRTCMARDVWGDYAFEKPLEVGNKIVFLDGLQYSLGEANWFNGHPRPDLAVLNAAGEYRVWRHFSYDDFKHNYSA